MKMMACIIDDQICLVRSVCPVCGKVFGVADLIWEYWQDLETGPVVGRYPGWDNAFDLCCDECQAVAGAMFGDGFMLQLEKEGALEVIEPLCTLARQLRYAADDKRKRAIQQSEPPPFTKHTIRIRLLFLSAWPVGTLAFF